MVPRLDGASVSIQRNLQRLYDSSPTLPLSAGSRFVVLSDFHLGDGSSRDDFLPNGDLLQEVLRRYYLPGGYSLVLNGDIEELQRFPLEAIRSRWQGLYGLFSEFGGSAGVYRIVGNHDAALWHAHPGVPEPLLSSVRLTFGSETIFVFHGHQASIFFERFNNVSGFFLRHFANRLNIRNMAAHYESTRKYRMEHRVYAFSSARKIVSVIGHTHRPLFESQSKIESLRFNIEQLCRDYPVVSPRARRSIERIVDGYKRELNVLWEEDRRSGLQSGLYNERLSVPCLFNSGCAIGKRGVTAIEIAEGSIALVHWFDQRRGARHLAAASRRGRRTAPLAQQNGSAAERLDDTAYYRTVLKRDQLEYIFSRIRLLT